MDSVSSFTSSNRPEEPDTRNSLRHILVSEPSREPSPARQGPSSIPADDYDRDEQASQGAGGLKVPDDAPMYTATTTTTRRNANGSVSSVYSGNKIRHLKKEDGVPLWRKDIQFDFLKLVFEDERRVFHKNSDGSPGHTFADIYLDAMAKSSKCSKILKDKLLTERSSAINMAMVCLLVNVGRMNTTLNFFPEMRAQLRTYHSIPSLQARQDPNAYKQLQDAPRLKSILKGATEDLEQPSTIDDIKAHPVPRTNPVNLIFVLAQYAPKISELHFFPPRDFFDLVMRSALSSRSRATAFLWLMWWYLESDFSSDDALNNPYGPGQYGQDGDVTEGMPIKCPPFEHLTEEQILAENVDTEEEKEFGEVKRKERLHILQSDMAPVVTGPKRNTKKGFNNNPVFSVMSDDGSATPQRGDNISPAPSINWGRPAGFVGRTAMADEQWDTDRTRSASPPSTSLAQPRPTPNMRINTLLNEETPPAQPVPPPATKGPGRGNWRRDRGTPGAGSSKPAFKARVDASLGSGANVIAPHGFYLPLNGADPTQKRSRPATAHQKAVQNYRQERVNWILDKKLRQHHERSGVKRSKEGAITRAWKRLKLANRDGYDTDEEIVLSQAGDETRAFSAGLLGLMPLNGLDADDYGEEVAAYASVFRKVDRRLGRWDSGTGVVKKKRVPKDTAGKHPLVWVGDGDDRDDGGNRGSSPMDEGERETRDARDYDAGDEELDDEDREMLGEVDADEDEDRGEEEELDDEDREMLGEVDA